MKIPKWIINAHPALLITGSYLAAIMAGVFLLSLPVSTHDGYITWTDAFFTATSAVCVTGLVVVETGKYFTIFGQIVILALIQIGGLGVMTISVALFQWIGRNVSFRQRMIMQDSFSHTPREDIFGLVKNIILFTIGVESIGALFLTIHWSRFLPLSEAIYTAIFHSVSAFCNAGFALFSNSMVAYRDSLILNITICSLIVLGGIGFPVIYDLQCWSVMRRKKRVRLAIHTKTVLISTLALILLGSLIFMFLEYENTLATFPFPEKVIASIFQSVTARTAGFNTVDIASLKDATLAILIFFMFIGASPGSCGGGVKTTTLALMIAFTVSRIKKRKRVTIFKKSIPNETITRSVALVLFSIVVIGIVLFLLLLGYTPTLGEAISQDRNFLAYLFETVSAFGTVGLSMGITPGLNSWGKFLLVAMMLIGRVGILTFAYIIVGTGAVEGLEYAEENLMVG